MTDHEAELSELEISQIRRCIEVIDETFNMVNSVLPALSSMLDIIGSHLRSPAADESLLSLSSCLETVGCDELLKAVANLSAFVERLDRLKCSQSSKTRQLGDEQEDTQLEASQPGYEGVGDGGDVFPYQYRELEEGHIRILELFPGAPIDPLLCRLVHVPMSDPGVFEAVSYTWGSEEPSRSIQVDQGTFFVRPNLEAALLEFRAGWENPIPFFQTAGNDLLNLPNSKARSHPEANGCRRLWIDAICIDQENIDERSQQVRMMSRIYTSSTRLLIWLGIASEDSDSAMDFVNRAAYKALTADAGTELSLEDINEIASCSLPEICQSFSNLFHRPWFTRAWILQEFILGSKWDSLFVCGSRTVFSKSFLELRTYQSFLAPQDGLLVDSSRLHLATRYSEGLANFLELFHGHSLHWVHAHNVRAIGKQNLEGDQVTTSLGYWLRRIRSMSCVDPKDKIFSFLGILENLNEDPRITGYDPLILGIDYSATVEHVFSNVVKSVVSTTGRLDIIGSAYCRGPCIKRTWIPDWTIGECSSSYESRLANQLPYAASGRLRCIATFAADLSVLKVQGFIWDAVILASATRSNLDGILSESPWSESFKTCFLTLWRLLSHSQVYGSEINMQQELWRTLLSDPLDLRKLLLKSQWHKEHVFSQAALLASVPQNDEQFNIMRIGDIGEVDTIFDSLSSETLKRFDMLNTKRTFVVSRKGYIGQTLFIDRVRDGDLVCILLGCSVPMLLRHVQDHYELIGEVYLNGIMYGEALKALDYGEVQLQEFELH